jgi:hypothetical protein
MSVTKEFAVKIDTELSSWYRQALGFSQQVRELLKIQLSFTKSITQLQ